MTLRSWATVRVGAQSFVFACFNVCLHSHGVRLQSAVWIDASCVARLNTCFGFHDLLLSAKDAEIRAVTQRLLSHPDRRSRPGRPQLCFDVHGRNSFQKVGLEVQAEIDSTVRIDGFCLSSPDLGFDFHCHSPFVVC